MCSQLLVPRPHSPASSSAPGAQKKAGATVITTSGRQRACASSTGRLLNAKLARCSSRVRPLGRRGTHRGQRRISTPPLRSLQ